MDFPTFHDLQRVARDEVLSRNSRITKEVIEREGSDANVLVAASAAVGDEVVGQLARVLASLTLGSAKGKDLDRLVFDRFGLLRKPAASAVGSVEFSTTVANPAPFAIPVGAKLQTVDGKQFLTTAAGFFPFGSVGPITVAVRSAAAGLAQQARANTITSVISTITGSPDDLAVTNSLATAGADDEETDDLYRARARRFFTTVRRGTLAAIEEQALRTPGVRKAVAHEFLDALGRPAKSVQLVVADAFVEDLALLNQNPVGYEAQSQVLAGQVFDDLSDTRPAGIFVGVLVARVVVQGVVLGLSFEAGVDPDEVALRARAAVVGKVNELQPGDPFRPEDMVAALRLVRGLVVTGGEVLSPPGDVVTASREVLRTTLRQVVASTVQPDAALAGTSNPDAA